MTATRKAKLAEILASLSNTMKSTLRLLHDNCARPVIRDLGFPIPGSRIAVLKNFASDRVYRASEKKALVRFRAN